MEDEEAEKERMGLKEDRVRSGVGGGQVQCDRDVLRVPVLPLFLRGHRDAALLVEQTHDHANVPPLGYLPLHEHRRVEAVALVQLAACHGLQRRLARDEGRGHHLLSQPWHVGPRLNLRTQHSYPFHCHGCACVPVRSPSSLASLPRCLHPFIPPPSLTALTSSAGSCGSAWSGSPSAFRLLPGGDVRNISIVSCACLARPRKFTCRWHCVDIRELIAHITKLREMSERGRGGRGRRGRGRRRGMSVCMRSCFSPLGRKNEKEDWGRGKGRRSKEIGKIKLGRSGVPI
eukprot:2189887-Rhodomonas_salina.2